MWNYFENIFLLSEFSLHINFLQEKALEEASKYQNNQCVLLAIMNSNIDGY